MKYLLLAALLALPVAAEDGYTGDYLISETKAAEDSTEMVEVHPRLARDFFYVSLAYSFGDEVNVDVFDVIGSPVAAYTFEGPRLMVDVSAFEPGVYFVCVRVEQTRITRRVIVY